MRKFSRFFKTLSIYWANLNGLHRWIQSATTACLASVNQAKCTCNCDCNWSVLLYPPNPFRPAPPQSGQKSNTHVWVFRFNANAWDNLILNLRSENETNWSHAHSCAVGKGEARGGGKGCSICCYWSSNKVQNLIKSCPDCNSHSHPQLSQLSGRLFTQHSLPAHCTLPHCGCICQLRLGSKVLHAARFLAHVYKVVSAFMTHIAVPGKLVTGAAWQW